MDKTLYIVVPAYNEAANIESTVREWYPIVEKHSSGGSSRLVVFNDGSRDDTLDILRRLEGEFEMLEVVDKPNSGHGPTLQFAYRYALDAGADLIFQTDSDGQTRPDEFEKFWDLRDDFAAVIGQRTGRQDGFSRVVVTKVLKLVLRMVYGLNVPDANTPFRLMHRELLEKYLPDIPEGFNLTNVMLSVMFLHYGEKVRYLPITFRPRQGGTNSINIPKIVKIGARAVKDFRSIKKSLRPRRK